MARKLKSFAERAEADTLLRLAAGESPAEIGGAAVLQVWHSIEMAYREIERSGRDGLETGLADAVMRWHLDRRGVTLREMEVIGLVASGYSNIEIGAQLVISSKTVQVHLANVMAKLGLSNRTELAVLAVCWGWVAGGVCAARIDMRRREPARCNW